MVASQCRRTLFRSRLSLKQTVDVFSNCSGRQLTAHNAVDLCAQFGNAIFAARSGHFAALVSRIKNIVAKCPKYVPVAIHQIEMAALVKGDAWRRAGRQPGSTRAGTHNIVAPCRLGPHWTAVQRTRYQSDIVKKPVIPLGYGCDSLVIARD
jgi:hypothetical protein